MRKGEQAGVEIPQGIEAGVEISEQPVQSEGEQAEVVLEEASVQLGKREDELNQAELMINDATDLPPAVRDGLKAEISGLRGELSGLAADRQAVASELSARDSGPHSKATVFRAHSKLPSSFLGRGGNKILEGLGIHDQNLETNVVLERTGLSPDALLAKVNEISRAQFDADPWNKRDIPAADVVKKYGDLDPNVAAYDDWGMKVGMYADENGMLAPEDLYRLTGRDRDSAHDENDLEEIQGIARQLSGS